MIPQGFKDIINNSENVGLYQTLALLLFIAFFIGLVFYVFSRPKKHYNEEEHAPLSEDIIDSEDHKN